MMATAQGPAPRGVEPVEKVMDRLKYRKDKRVTMVAQSVLDLNLHWRDEGPDAPQSGYYADIDGKGMRLNDTAMKTACKLIKTKPEYFRQFQDKSAFPQDMINILTNPARRGSSGSGLLVRHDGLEVNAVLPREYQVRDAYDFLGGFLDPLSRHVGEIHGIQAIETGWGDRCSYRVVCGNNIMPSLKEAKLGQFMMFALDCSETGLDDAQTRLGIMRNVCTNSAFRMQTLSKWDHKADGGNFYDRAARTISNMGHYQSQFTTVFEALLREPLEMPAGDILSAFKRERLITKEHYDSAVIHARGPTEDGRKCETHYDLFNVCTRAAQDLASQPQRVKAETTAFSLFADAGGWRQALAKASGGGRWRPEDN